MSDLKCNICKSKPGSSACDDCPEKPALIALLQEEIKIAKKVHEETKEVRDKVEKEQIERMSKIVSEVIKNEKRE